MSGNARPSGRWVCPGAGSRARPTRTLGSGRDWHLGPDGTFTPTFLPLKLESPGWERTRAVLRGGKLIRRVVIRWVLKQKGGMWTPPSDPKRAIRGTRAGGGARRAGVPGGWVERDRRRGKTGPNSPSASVQRADQTLSRLHHVY